VQNLLTQAKAFGVKLNAFIVARPRTSLAIGMVLAAMIGHVV